jgi:hypothetical protein
MTEAQRRLLVAGGVAALFWYLSRSPKAQADLSALYRALTQGLGGAAAPGGPADGAVGVGGGPATDFLSSLARYLRASSTQPASVNVFRLAAPTVPAGTPSPSLTPSQIASYVSQAVQNGFKAVQQIVTPDSLLNQSLDYVKSLFSGASATLDVTGGTVGAGADVLGTGATTVTAPDVLLPVGQSVYDPLSEVVATGSGVFDPAVTGAAPALEGSGYVAGGVGDAVPAAELGAGAVDAAGGSVVDVGGAVAGGVTEATTVGDSAIFASEGVAAAIPAASIVGGIAFGASVAIGAGLAAWQESELQAGWPTFGRRLRDVVGKINYAISGAGGDPLSRRLSRVTTKQELADEIGGFKSAIEGAGVGGYASQGGVFELAPIPGAGGSAHEGGVTADFSVAQQGLQTYINQLAATLPGPVPTAVDTNSTKYKAAQATYADPGDIARYPDPLSSLRGIELGSMGGGNIAVGTVSGTDTIRQVAVPDTRTPAPSELELTTQYANPALFAPSAP